MQKNQIIKEHNMVSCKENKRLLSKEGEREEKIRKKADMKASSWPLSDLG